MTTLHLTVDRTTGLPIHRQIYDGLRGAILDGRLRPGQRIPSSRALAVDLGVSRLPVLSAYDQLLHEGYLVGRIGSGTFVSEGVPDDLLHPAPANVRMRSARRSNGAVRRHVGANRLGVASWSFPVVPFQGGLPALDLFPFAVWAKLIARHVHAETPARMAYSDPAGLEELRVAIAAHLRAARAVRCEADQVLIVSGSQAALRLATAALFDAGDRVALEEPGYFGARRALRSGGVEIVPVPVDEDGLNVAALERRGERIRAVYVTPSHQYPLGMTMSGARRFALLEWAARHDAWILEDDYDSEFRYVSRPVASLQGMDAHDRVIYIGTFSKSFGPAVRLGYLVVPRALMAQFVETRVAFDFFTPTLYQRALAEFLREGHFARHLRRMRSAYQERRDALLRGVDRHCGDLLRVHNADAGLHVAALLRDGLDDQNVIARLSGRGLAAISLSDSYLGPTRRQGLLLGFGCATPQRLIQATCILGEVLSESRLR